MKMHPVILHSSEGKAILAGKQSQIRVAAWQFDVSSPTQPGARKPTRYQKLKPGDLLWVQETFVEFVGWRRGAGHYGMSYGTIGSDARAPAHMLDVERKVHQRQAKDMVRGQSRLTLEVDRTWSARLGDIGLSDILASGIVETWQGSLGGYAPFADTVPSCGDSSPRAAFEKFWNVCHGRDSWRPNLEVVAIAFRAHGENVNALVDRLNGETGALAVASECLGGARMGGRP